MHRSGTSALSRVLSLLGAGLPQNVMGPGPGNETGHWEPARLVEAHDRMLAALGSNWDDWRALALSDIDPEVRSSLCAELSSLFDEEYDTGATMVLKDPRMCRFVPLYANLLASKGIDARYVLALRHPLAVVASLFARDGMCRTRASLLWLCHTLEAERATRGTARVVVSYEALMGEWAACVERITEKLELSWPRNPADAKAEIDAYLSRDLCHHEASLDDLDSGPGVAGWVRRAYVAMRALESDPNDAKARAELDDVRAEFDELSQAMAHERRDLVALGHLLDGERREFAVHNEAMENERRKLARALEARETTISDKISEIKELRSKLISAGRMIEMLGLPFGDQPYSDALSPSPVESDEARRRPWRRCIFSPSVREIISGWPRSLVNRWPSSTRNRNSQCFSWILARSTIGSRI